MSASLNKSALRAQFLAARSTVPAKDRALWAKAAALHLRESLVFQQAKNIACYFSLPNEFDMAFIQQVIIQAGKQCYLPVLTPKKSLIFSAYTPGDVLVPNVFNIPEPVVQPNKTIAPETLDLVLLPLVAFDKHGNRLGMGGGYYDRTFAFMRAPMQKPFLIGVGYQVQAAASLPIESTDVRLHAVLTEQGLQTFA